MKRELIAIVIATAVAGCSVTEQQKPPEGEAVPTSGFLQNYSQLQPGGKDQALLVYINQNAAWGGYRSVMIEPVTIGLSPDSQMSVQDQQLLSSYYYHALENALSKDFTIVSAPGPAVMTVRVALTDGSTTRPVMRTISVVIPQARLLNAAQSLATGSYAFVGGARSEGEVLDSMTGMRLAAAVDAREGGMSVKNAFGGQWNDAKAAMDYWAERMDQRLVELKSGTAMAR
jgi:hypothetical protein